MAMRLDHGTDELEEVHGINLTPFIDVMLVLLIIFMVAAPLATVDIGVNFARLDRACSFDERSNAGPVLRALIMPCKKSILAIQNKRTDASLNDIGIEL